MHKVELLYRYICRMNLPLNIARRYLFGKRNTNAINIITGIAVFGLTVGTAAMVLVLSVFNGFEDLITGMYSDLNPDLLVTAKKGKTFEIAEVDLQKIKEIESVDFIAKTIEEKAVFDARDNKQTIGILKGVDDNFRMVTKLDSSLLEGRYAFKGPGDQSKAVLGSGMSNSLGIDINNPLAFINVYTVKKKRVGPFEQPFRKRLLYPAGTFYIEPEFNDNYIISSLEFAQDLLQIGDQVSALEIKLFPGYAPKTAAKAILDIIGDEYTVKDRFAQNEAFLKLMKIEKWMAFAIVGLMLLLVAFNLIGALWMVVLEKRKDIAVLKSMGADGNLVLRIFLNQGILLSILGVLSGFILALLAFFVQKQFDVIGIPGAFSISAYPISLRLFDFLAVAATVLGIGFIASIMPARRAKKVPALIREE
ncbi:MAG: FtsX-like permease family protein [Bacteroidota bacterium]